MQSLWRSSWESVAGLGGQEKVAGEADRPEPSAALQAVREVTLLNGDVQFTFGNKVLDLISKAGAQSRELNVILGDTLEPGYMDTLLRVMKDGKGMKDHFDQI